MTTMMIVVDVDDSLEIVLQLDDSGGDLEATQFDWLWFTEQERGYKTIMPLCIIRH